ncbi:MAG: HU family DNA-binding protein [Bacteroidales bacterium]|nr:HU family DNA-binding protein [Bacteroidales bacterium]
MTTLNRHIQHLLSIGQRVTLPGIGTFTPVMRSASLEGNLLTPPRSTVSFDASFSAGDKTLENSIIRKEDCSSEQARRIIDEAASEAAQNLAVGREIALDEVGTLSGRGTSSEFSPAGHFACSDWLAPIELKPLEVRRVEQAEVAKVADTLQERRSSLMRSLSRTASSAAAIAVLALITFIWAQLPGKARHAAQTASFGIENIAPETSEPLIDTPGASEPALVLILNTPADGVAPAKRRVEKPVTTAPDRYIMVVASLASEKEAETFVREHADCRLDLRVIHAEGRWRVYALSSPSFEDINAMARRKDIYTSFPTAWVCRC